MARTFVLEPTKVEVAQASRFGDVTYIFKHGDHRPSIWTDEFKAAVTTRLESLQFDPAHDAFVVAGHMVPVTIVIAILLRAYGRVRVLFYSAVERDYVPRLL